MIQIAYDGANPWQIIERDKTNWKVTVVLYNSVNQILYIGEGEGWDYESAYNLAQRDIDIQRS